MELCFGLVFLSWTSARLPSALKISGYYFRQVLTMMISPLFIFILSNFIVVILLLNSSLVYPNTSIDDETKLCKSLTESSVHCGKLSEIFAPVPAPDEIAFQDKRTISEVIANRESDREIETVTDVKCCSEQEASPVRIQPEDSKDAVESESCEESLLTAEIEIYQTPSNPETVDELTNEELAPTEIENFRRLSNPDDATEEETVDELTNEEFQRAIEAFIAKQIKFHREESADKCVMASSGFQADVRALQKLLAARHLIYQHQHNKQMSCPGMAQLLSNTLYYKRFFPYYSFNVVGGLDNEGKGCVFTYDAVGSYERVGYSSQGSGSTLIMPFLDNQLKSPSPLLLPAQDAVTPLSENEAIDLVKTCFASATERDIYTGDRLEIVVLNSEGIRREENGA
nr:proteasome subunit beta type-1 [Ipomoea batatas]